MNSEVSTTTTSPSIPEAGDSIIIRIPGWHNVSGHVYDVGAMGVGVSWLTGEDSYVALSRCSYIEGTGWMVDVK